MTTNNEAFEKFIAELDFQDIAHDTESIRNLYLRAWQAATTEANKRIAELEVQLQNWKDFSKKVQKIDFNDYLQLQAHINHLREAFNGYHLAIKQRALTVDIEEKLLKLLKATPAESLQAFENEVLERAATELEKEEEYGYYHACIVRSLKEVK